MFRRVILGSCIPLFLSMAAAASPPKVVVDIAPVHSLVAQVMAGVGEPDLVIRAGASPLEYSLRPSEAKALSRADVVFWIGEEFTPWLEASLENLASGATKVALLEIPGTTLYDFREGATFEAHDHHDDENGHDDEHAHEEEDHDDEHAHEEDGHDDEHAQKEEHDHEGEDHHDEHGEHDPHAWLDPANAKVWLQAIAGVLSEKDAANAATYRSNATEAIAKLDAQIASIRTQIQKLRDRKFIVFHDAYQYFERRFDIQATGAISIGDASDPSPKRVKEIRDTVAELGIRCVFSEPQFNPQMVRTVFESTEVTTIGVIDPIGADIAIGKNHYHKLLEALVSSIAQCQK